MEMVRTALLCWYWTLKNGGKNSQSFSKKKCLFKWGVQFNRHGSLLVRTFASQTPVNEVWGVGRNHTKALNQLGIHHVLDLIEAHPKNIRQKFSVVMEKTVRELQGISCIDIEQDTPRKQQILSSRSYGQPVYELEDIKASIRCIYFT